MSQQNKNDEFFSQEYEKLEDKQQPKPASGNVSDWASYNSPTPTAPKKFWILIVSVALVLTFVAGFIFATLLKDTPKQEVPTNELLNTVMEALETAHLYADDITDEDWIAMVENAGTAMLQTVDKYGYLFSPQSAYDLDHPVATTASKLQGYFGMSYQYSQFGLYVSSVSDDSNCFGKLKKGDLIVRFENCLGKDGWALEFSEFNVADIPQADTVDRLSRMDSCTVVLLRSGELKRYDLKRSNIGMAGNNEFAMVEYYFGPGNTNLSTSPQNGAATYSVADRCLDRLPANVGYIRLTEFSRMVADNGWTFADAEIKKALDKFKESNKTKLILDLKGNPGGEVTIAANIIGMLANSNDPTYTTGGLLACTLTNKNGATIPYRASTDYRLYNYYFGSQDGATKDIVVWTDENSASASELTTGALLDYGTAIHMGTTTYGKGIAQRKISLNQYKGEIVDIYGNKSTYHWMIYYTTDRYYSPKGTNIHGVGYTPSALYNDLDTYTKLMDATIAYWS